MKKALLILLLVLSCTANVIAQSKTRHGKHNSHVKTNTQPKVVKQPLVDVTTVKYSYYDASKGGYIFIDDGRQSFLPALPILPENKPLRTSVPLTKSLDLDLYPQLHYPQNSQAANSH